jgi:ribosome-binding protein aMBF1 (putative translation factor)
MGMLKTENCPICGMPTSAFQKSSAKYNGLYVCQNCAKALADHKVKLWRLKKYPLDELRRIAQVDTTRIEQHEKDIKNFTVTKNVGNLIQFDDTHKKVAILKTKFTGKVYDMFIFDYSSIVDYELLEDGESIEKGGVGRAIVGGALFGGVGAIVGAGTGHKHKKTCTNLQLKITLDNVSMPVAYVNFINTATKKNGFVYKQMSSLAQEALSILSIITKAQEENHANAKNFSEADEILKFKKLLDEGIITQEEFEKKKKQLLNL